VEANGAAVADFRFDCVFYYVRDLDRAVAFYTSVLGLVPESRDVVARFRLDGVLVELVPAPPGMEPGGAGNARLTLEVSDIHSTMAELRAAGVWTSGVREVANGRVGAIADPDGNEICLWEYA
jgi:catechol 2,3-dioxygenase-like lactoylglutathione lyase family enzyme